jgi:hypothetical protein
MRDPLDTHNDPFEAFNAEARRQGRAERVGFTTTPMAVRKLFGVLRPAAENPEPLEEARERLTRVEHRMAVELFCYSLGGPAAQDCEDLPAAPPAELDDPLPLPAFPAARQAFEAARRNPWRAAVRPRPMAVTPLARYDRPWTPDPEILFDV